MKDDVVVGMGEILWDMLPEGKQMGGAPANFAYHVGQFGVKSCVVSAVGRDEAGREILDTLDRKGINYLIEQVDYPTGTVEIELDDRGIPVYEITEDVAWDNIPFTPAMMELARRTVAVCFGSLAQRSELSRRTIDRFLQAVPDSERRLIVFDINLRQNFYSEKVLSDSISRCDVLKINDEELAIVGSLYGIAEEETESMCRRIMERFGLKILILTCGINGSYVFTPDAVSFLPTPMVEVADTVGAGDSFTAAFIASLLKGHTVGYAHEKAVATSAYVCTCKGATPLLPPHIR